MDKNSLQAVLKTEDGRKVISDILDKAGILTLTSVEVNPSFADGRRSIGLEILEMMQAADENAYANLITWRNKHGR